MNFNFNAREEQGKCENDEEDYYKILEITRDASSEDIKKAYRKLSMIHHPDKNCNSEESTIKFKLLASAYETLGNPDKKKLYDMGIRGGNGSPFGDFENVNPFDIFNMIFSSMGAPQQQQHIHGFPPPSFIRGGMGPIQIGSMGPMGMGLGGMGIHIINSSGGGGPMHQMHNHPHFHFLHQQQQQQQQQQQPQFFYETMQQQPMSSMPSQSREPITKNVNITLENAYFGIEHLSVNLSEFHNDATITVCIPPGINDKEVLILSNVTSTTSSFHFSQINIIVNIEQHSIFKRNDIDLILEKEISLKDSLCGLEFTIKHINNKSFHLQHKDGTIIKHNTTKTIPGLGMMDKNKQCGNLIIVFKIVYPDKLTREQIDALSTVL
jgi:DnaJ family protein A protein 2